MNLTHDHHPYRLDCYSLPLAQEVPAGSAPDCRSKIRPCLPLPKRVTAGALLCLTLLLLLGGFPTAARAADNLFNSGAVIRDELSRVGEEGKLFLKAPVDPYLAQSAAVAGAFALSYIFDRDIRSDLAGTHSTTLDHATDAGSFVGNPYIHIGVAAALYGAGAASDSPRLMRIGEELGEALLISDAATVVLKQAVGRGRPATGDGNSRYKPFQFASDYDSLPSMHTASSFAMAHVLASETESLPVKIFCYAAASFVGFSRLYQDKHWASDVVLAAAIGELAGNSVTRFRAAQPGTLTLAPLVNDGVPGLALLGKF
jgi:membrane-associated phospholipid phosphatase